MTLADVERVLQEALTESQRLVVTDPARRILALACAGSGKSTTLAFRIAYLIANGASPREIVAFTFTENAAESIKLRVSQALTRCALDPASRRRDVRRDHPRVLPGSSL